MIVIGKNGFSSENGNIFDTYLIVQGQYSTTKIFESNFEETLA